MGFVNGICTCRGCGRTWVKGVDGGWWHGDQAVSHAPLTFNGLCAGCLALDDIEDKEDYIISDPSILHDFAAYAWEQMGHKEHEQLRGNAYYALLINDFVGSNEDDYREFVGDRYCGGWNDGGND